MNLRSLLAHVHVRSVRGDLDRPVTGVTRDTRELGPQGLFVAIRGARVDGHDLVPELARAAAVVVERSVDAPPGITVIEVPDTHRALAELAAAFHGEPARALRVVAVTGTNGKTTITTLVELALEALGVPAGRIGTTGTSVRGVVTPSSLTTPEAPVIQALLASMRDQGVAVVAMEASSIGIVQERVAAIPFHVGVYTNLGRDHLDFHGTMEAYGAAKARLFTELLRPAGGRPRALLCADDAVPAALAATLPDAWTYGFGDADLRIVDFAQGPDGMTFTARTPLGDAVVASPLVGRHNAQNLAAALGVLLLLDQPLAAAARAVGAVAGVPGRLERVPNERGLLVLVDYAHTEDALEAALSATRGATPGALWVVFGCGGDRDVGKRPRMGAVAERLADHVVVTSDNPRSESPQRIVDAILGGMRRPPDRVELDRSAAIAWALRSAAPGDSVVIAGKGHETYQEQDGTRRPFDDRDVARRVLEGTP